MAIHKHFEELSEIFEIRGIYKRQLLPFDKNMIFTGKPSARKMARAKATLEMVALVEKNSRQQQPRLTALQTELVFLYNQKLTEKQQKQLDVFLFEFFDDDDIIEPHLQPKKKLAIKRNQLTPFQAQLLSFYDRAPNEEQMLQLKDFLYKLFNNLPNKVNPQSELEITA